jgi:hypothetical protein
MSGKEPYSMRDVFPHPFPYPARSYSKWVRWQEGGDVAYLKSIVADFKEYGIELSAPVNDALLKIAVDYMNGEMPRRGESKLKKKNLKRDIEQVCFTQMANLLWFGKEHNITLALASKYAALCYNQSIDMSVNERTAGSFEQDYTRNFVGSEAWKDHCTRLSDLDREGSLSEYRSQWEEIAIKLREFQFPEKLSDGRRMFAGSARG